MPIGVIGTGHVGLVTCVSLARLGHDVFGTDSYADKLVQLQDGLFACYVAGRPPISEDDAPARSQT